MSFVYFPKLEEVGGAERIHGGMRRPKARGKKKGADGPADGRGSQGDAETNKGSESMQDRVGESEEMGNALILMGKKLDGTGMRQRDR